MAPKSKGCCCDASTVNGRKSDKKRMDVPEGPRMMPVTQSICPHFVVALSDVLTTCTNKVLFRSVPRLGLEARKLPQTTAIHLEVNWQREEGIAEIVGSRNVFVTSPK